MTFFQNSSFQEPFSDDDDIKLIDDGCSKTEPPVLTDLQTEDAPQEDVERGSEKSDFQNLMEMLLSL